MNEILTRPIPEFAVEAFRKDRVAEAIRSVEFRSIEQIGLQSNQFGFDSDTLIAAQSSNKWASPWRRARDAAAAAAVTLLVQNLSMPPPPTTCHFLSIVLDHGVSRPMLEMSEVKTEEAPSVCSRAAASMQPMDLSDADANIIKQALATGSSRPRIKIAVLPEYQG